MNDQTGSSKTEQPNALRRRLTKGGLAAPIVLASLASKPVLADPNLGAPWICTLSGQLSGNMSGHTVAPCDQGATTLFGYTADFPAAGAGAHTIMQEFPQIGEDLIFFTGSELTLSSAYPVATIYQVLTTSSAQWSAEDYARRAFAIFLNARNIYDPSVYPLTENQAIKLFIAACKQQSFEDTNPTINWNYEQVKAYIDLLYP